MTPIRGAGGGGEANTASNVGTAGVGVFKQKTLVDLEFKKINAGSSKITVADDVANSEVDIDLGAHSTTHQSGGSDAIKLDDLATPDDNTDLDVSITLHGLVPKAPNDTTKFLRGDATWAVPPAGGGSTGFVTIAKWGTD